MQRCAVALVLCLSFAVSIHDPFVAKGGFGVLPMVGNLLYLTARAIDARHAVEFGTSFGISAIYLAAAMPDNGGRFVGSDNNARKVAIARRNLDEAGLSAFSEVREGDALQTFRRAIANAAIELGEQPNLNVLCSAIEAKLNVVDRRMTAPARRRGFEGGGAAC